MENLSDHILVIIQSRMGSSRLPGKSFNPIAGKPALEHILDGVEQFTARERIVVATSEHPDNHVITGFCEARGIDVFRGDEENVASRFTTILDDRPNCRYFFRICGDMPLLDHRTMRAGLDIIERSDTELDLVSSMPNRGFPQGQNIELLSARTFLEHYPRFSDDNHFKHVTQYFYQNLGRFMHQFMTCNVPGYYYEKYKFSVDTRKDYDRISGIFQQMDKPHYEYSLAEKCRMYDRLGQSKE